MEEQMNGNRIFAISILIFLVLAIVVLFSIDERNKNQVQNQQSTKFIPETISNSVFKESFGEGCVEPNPVKYFDPQNTEYYWVARWNAPCSDGAAYDGWFLEGTKIDSLVYYINTDTGKPSEEYFYFKHLTRDPRDTAWWQQNVSYIHEDIDIKTLFDAIAQCACTEDYPDITRYFLDDIKKLGLIHKQNLSREDFRIILLRYTSFYYGDNFTIHQAITRLKKYDSH
ncbi:MAG TPA: hypothetical protein PKL13_03380 [bacterium]|nr:hypothetical protein [bacterium]